MELEDGSSRRGEPCFIRVNDTTELIPDMQDRTSGDLPVGTWDFSFVNSRALFVTTANGSGSVELFSFTCDPVDAAGNGDGDGDGNADSLVHVATLLLPPIHTSVRVLCVSTHTGPFLAGCPPGATFASSSADRIHVMTVQYVHLPTLDGPRTRPRVGVVVHQRALEKILERYATPNLGRVQKSPAGPAEVPWEEWGQTHARMLPHMGLIQWLRYVISFLAGARCRLSNFRMRIDMSTDSAS